MARPLGITILAALVMIAALIVTLVGIVGMLIGLTWFLPGSPVQGPELILSGFLFFILGIVLGIAGTGLLRLRPWAWWLALLATVGSLVYTGYQVYQSWRAVNETPTLQSLLTLAFEAVLLVYLLTVYRHFRRPAAAM